MADYLVGAMAVPRLLRNLSEQPRFLCPARDALFAAHWMQRHVQGRGKRSLDVDGCRLVASRLDLEVVEGRSVNVGLRVELDRKSDV